MAAVLAQAPDIFLYCQLKLLEEVGKPLWIYRFDFITVSHITLPNMLSYQGNNTAPLL